MKKSMRKKIIYFVILLSMPILAGGCSGEKEDLLLTESREDAFETDSEKDDRTEEVSQEDSVIYVQVSGAVAKPGVYELKAGSRIFQAVELAGGVTEEADTGTFNQAEVLEDGQMVYILSVEEAAEQSVQTGLQQEDGRLDLNTATEAELMTLPGIGEAKARSIIAWREENGGFHQTEDLMKIEGIKDGVFSKIKDSIKVD